MATSVTGFKLKFAERNHNPQCAPAMPLMQGAVVRPEVPVDTSVGGRKSFAPRYSGYQEMGGKKVVQHREGGVEDARRGRKYIEPRSSSQREEPASTGGIQNGIFTKTKSNLMCTIPSAFSLEQAAALKERRTVERTLKNGDKESPFKNTGMTGFFKAPEKKPVTLKKRVETYEQLLERQGREQDASEVSAMSGWELRSGRGLVEAGEDSGDD
jgi:hypothetical protein